MARRKVCLGWELMALKDLAEAGRILADAVLCHYSIGEKASDHGKMGEKRRRDFDRNRGIYGTARRVGSE